MTRSSVVRQDKGTVLSSFELSHHYQTSFSSSKGLTRETITDRPSEEDEMTTAGRQRDQDVNQSLAKTHRCAPPSSGSSVTLLQRFKIKFFFCGIQTMKETNKAGTASTIHTQNTIPDHKNMQMNTMAYVAQNSE